MIQALYSGAGDTGFSLRVRHQNGKVPPLAAAVSFQTQTTPLGKEGASLGLELQGRPAKGKPSKNVGPNHWPRCPRRSSVLFPPPGHQRGPGCGALAAAKSHGKLATATARRRQWALGDAEVPCLRSSWRDLRSKPLRKGA